MSDTTHRTRVGLFNCLQVSKTTSPPDWVLAVPNYSVTTLRDMSEPLASQYTYYRTLDGRKSLIKAGSWIVGDPIQDTVFVVDDDCFQAFFEPV